METTTERTQGMPSMDASDFVYETIKGLGKVGGYLHSILADTVYYTGKYVAYIWDACSNCQVPLFTERREGSKVTLVRLVKSDAGIDEADKKEFYLNFGRDMAAVTKSGIESENLTIIDLTKYEL